MIVTSGRGILDEHAPNLTASETTWPVGWISHQRAYLFCPHLWRKHPCNRHAARRAILWVLHWKIALPSIRKHSRRGWPCRQR